MRKFLLPDAWSGYIVVADFFSAKNVRSYGFGCFGVPQFIFRLHDGISLPFGGKFDLVRKKTKIVGEEAMINVKFV
jgi:hypothetical protein